MTIFYSDTYTFPLPEGHRFPTHKYRLLRDVLLADGVVVPEELHVSEIAAREHLLHVHTRGYVDDFCNGTINPKIVRRIGIPWSKEFALRSMASVGGTIAAARVALQDRIAGNLAGGTHHAFADEGEGFCVFNDIAVAARTLLYEGLARNVAIIDLDVHQGNGTAAILGNDPNVFTMSMHGKNNFPFRKVPSTLDIPLANGTGDDEYLALLGHALPAIVGFGPDIIFYQAGVDVLAHDSLGKLAMTHAGVMERDRMVLAMAAEYEIPIVLTLGGGYSKPIEATVQGYAGTYRVAKKIFQTSGAAA